MSSRYTKRDFTAYCKERQITPMIVYVYRDSNGQERLASIPDDLDWGAKINRLARELRESEELAEEVRRLTGK